MYDPKEEYEVIDCPGRFRLTAEDIDTDIRIHFLNKIGFNDYKLFFVDMYSFDELRSKLVTVENGVPFIGVDIKLIYGQIAEDGLDGDEAIEEFGNLIKREIAKELVRGYCALHKPCHKYATDDLFNAFVDSWMDTDKIDIGILLPKIS